MPSGAYARYSEILAFRPPDPAGDDAALIAFGRDLYVESLGNDRAFRRDYGARGERFPCWIASCAASGPGFAALLIENGAPIGLVALGRDRRDKKLGRVHHFYVVPHRRGRGFGGLLDDYARETLARAGCRRAMLNVTAQNDRALRFYAAQGWVEMATHARAGLRYMEIAL